MVYYHGSNVKFSEFDLDKCNNKRLCLSPHYEYAKLFGKYIYFVEVGAYKDYQYKENMQNITFMSLNDIKIIKIEKN